MIPANVQRRPAPTSSRSVRIQPRSAGKTTFHPNFAVKIPMFSCLGVPRHNTQHERLEQPRS